MRNRGGEPIPTLNVAARGPAKIWRRVPAKAPAAVLNALAVYRPFVAAQLRLLFGPPRRSAGNATTNVSSLPIAMVHL